MLFSGVLRFTGFAIAVGAMWAGCGYVDGSRTPSDAEPFTTDERTYSPGDEVLLTLRNVYGQPIGYNLCSSQLQRSVNDAWEPVQEDRICTLQLETLEPGEVDTFSVSLPDTLAEAVAAS